MRLDGSLATRSSFVKFREWTGERTVATLGSNAGSIELPFQGWRRFKEAFAPELVERALTETPGQVRHVVDPFGGSGTTALAAQFLGVRPTTIEVNPFLADLIEAKLVSYDLDQAAAAFGSLVDAVWQNARKARPVFPSAPRTFVEPGVDGRYIFSKSVARRIVAYKAAIGDVRDPTLQRLFRVVLGSTLIPASNVTVSGKGRRYRRGWETRPIEPDVVDELFREGVLSALYDLRRFGARRCRDFSVIRGDARSVAGTVGSCDLAVFSPPYPNSFDYTDVYNVELWALGYLDSRASNSRLRNATLRSHVQILRDMSANKAATPTLARTVDALKSVQGDLWNRHIPDMVAAYTADMETILGALSSNLRPGGRIYMVVGDSRYAGVDVPVATILAELAPSLDYHVRELEPCRSMRVSPQQGGHYELPESLIVLEKE
jgi:hypothetical protein